MTEDSLQIQTANYLRKQYPKMLWCHVPNGGLRNKRVAHKLKQMGTRAGMPDVLIFEQRDLFNGLAIELKVGRNKPTEYQVKALNELKRNRWETAVCYSIEDVMKTIDKYLNKTI